MFLMIIANAQEVGVVFVNISAIIMLFILVADVWYLFVLLKKALRKHKLFLRPIIFLNCVAPIFYVCSLTFYDIFGFKKLLLYYILPFLAISFVLIIAGFVMFRRTTRKKSVASYSLLCGVLFGFGALISRKTNELMTENLSENAHFLAIAVLVLLANGFTFAVAFFDLLRYYYFTKLEKMGLVTEDILKPKE